MCYCHPFVSVSILLCCSAVSVAADHGTDAQGNDVAKREALDNWKKKWPQCVWLEAESLTATRVDLSRPVRPFSRSYLGEEPVQDSYPIFIVLHEDGFGEKLGRMPKLGRPCGIAFNTNRDDTPKIDTGTLSAFEHMKDLVYLNLGHTATDDKVAKAIADFHQIKVLNLSRTQITHVGIAELSRMKGLEELVLGDRGQELAHGGLRELGELANLERVDLRRSAVWDGCLKDIEYLKHLKALDLSDTKVSDEGLKHLREVKTLEYINLEDTKVTGAGLAGCASLRVLLLQQTKTDDAGLARLEPIRITQNY